MDREEMIQFADTWFRRVWNERDESAIDDMLAPDAWVEGFGPSGTRLQGKEAFREAYKGYLASFPEITITMEYAAVEGITVICWLKCEALAVPSAFGLEGEPKRVQFTTVVWANVVDGMCTGGRNLVDVASVVSQLQT